MNVPAMAAQFSGSFLVKVVCAVWYLDSLCCGGPLVLLLDSPLTDGYVHLLDAVSSLCLLSVG